jgi:PAS domain S-box-containing protein
MGSRSYSFLDVAVMETVRARLAAGDALVVLDVPLKTVLWANGPGAELFGHSEIFSFIGADPELPLQVRRQIEATSGFPQVGRDRPVALRLTAGMASRVLPFAASSIAMPDGEPAILLASADAAVSGRSREEIAARAIGGLSGDGQFVALVDDRGALLAASEGFAALGVVGDTLRELAAEAAAESDRLVKRLVPAGRESLPTGMARLSEEPPLNLLMIVDECALEAPAPDGIPAAAAEPAAAAPEPAAPAQPEALPASAEATQPAEPASTGRAAQPSAAATPDAPAPVAAEQPAAPTEQRPPRRSFLQSSDDDGWYFNGSASEGRAQENAAAPRQPADGDEEARHAPAAELAAMPLRFVWRTDAESRFSAISDEFRAAFGDEAADVIGHPFGEVARRFGLDPDDEIAGLLARRDTWSGRAVLWPVAGTDLKVPVDLAALPVYDRDRNFEGFRGFGVARMGDAIVDPEAVGLSLRPPEGEAEPETAQPAVVENAPAESVDAEAVQNTVAAEPIDERAPVEATNVVEGKAPAENVAPAEVKAPAEDAYRGEPPALRFVPEPERPSSDKVIRLEERRTGNAARGLSAAERLNFREIGEKLRNSGLVTGGERREEQPKAAEPAETQVKDAAASPPAVTKLPDEQPVTSAPEAAAEATVPGEQAEPPAADEAQDVTRADAISDGMAGADDEGERPVAAEEEAEAAAAEAPTTIEAATGNMPPAAEDAPAAAENKPAEVEETSEAAEAEAPASSPAPSQDAAPARPAEAFVPSAFAGLPAQAGAAGIDTAVLSRLPLPLLVHAGDALFFANREFLQLTGYGSLGELHDAGGLGAIFGDPYASDEAAQRKLRLRTRDGAEFPVDAFLQSVAWNGGKALLLALKRAAAEEAPAAPTPAQPAAPEDAETRLEELRTIIDTATDGVVIIGNDAKVRSISRPAEALFGVDGFNLVGQPFASLFAIESQKAATDYLASLAENGVASVLNDGREVIGREAQGRFIPLFMTIGRLPHDSGFCAVLRDITQWKRAEENLTEARTQAERASSSKTEFLARVSHEIRTPLNAIIGFSELMMDEKFGPIGNERYKDYLRDINKSGNHVLDLVNDLLDITKIEAGQQEMSYEAVSLNEALSEAVAMMQPQANRERVIIRSSFASRLPEVVADLRSIRQIALNLLSNAIRYTPAGGQVIVSTAYETSGDIVMRVRDTGIGMAAAEIEQALKPFKQINALKRPRGDGTGLGLPLTKAMVEANRARFAIHSAPGEGTLVEVTFPSTRVLAH